MDITFTSQLAIKVDLKALFPSSHYKYKTSRNGQLTMKTESNYGCPQAPEFVDMTPQSEKEYTIMRL